MPPFDDPPELRKAEGREEHKRIYEAWDWILARELEGEEAARHRRKDWFDYPAMMQVTVTTPHVIKHLRHLPWARPMNFMNAPIVAHGLLPASLENLSLVGRYDPDPKAWRDAIYYDRRNGNPCQIGPETGRILTGVTEESCKVIACIRKASFSVLTGRHAVQRPEAYSSG